MAQDYHIYLHGVSTNESGNKTTPFSAKQESGETSNFATAKQAFGAASSVAQGNGVNMGVAALTKIAPWVATAVVTFKVLDKVTTTGFSHIEEYTGNYKYSVDYNNFKTEIYNTIHPVRYWLSIQHQRAQFNKQNKQIAQQNRLIGNSILKDFNLGV